MSDYQVRENSYQKKESELPEQRNWRGLDLAAAEYAKGMLFADSFPWEKSFKKGGRKGKTQILRREVQSLASNLIGDMIGMTYRCRFDCKMTME